MNKKQIRLTYKQWLKFRKHTRKHHKTHISWLGKERKKYSQFLYKHRKGITTTKRIIRGIGKAGRATGRGAALTYGFVRKETPIITQKTRVAAKRFSGFVGREIRTYKAWQVRRKLAQRGIQTYK